MMLARADEVTTSDAAISSRSSAAGGVAVNGTRASSAARCAASGAPHDFSADGSEGQARVAASCRAAGVGRAVGRNLRIGPALGAGGAERTRT